MFQRAASSIIATAAACAAAVLAVFALGFALYAVLEPHVGPPGAAALVALAAAAGVGLYALITQMRMKAAKREEETAQAQLLAAIPDALGDFTKDRPVATLAASLLGGAVAARHPRLARDLIAIVAAILDARR